MVVASEAGEEGADLSGKNRNDTDRPVICSELASAE